MSAIPRPTEAVRLASALAQEFGGADVQRHKDGSLSVLVQHDAGDIELEIQVRAAVRRELPNRHVWIGVPRPAKARGREWMVIRVAAGVDGGER